MHRRRTVIINEENQAGTSRGPFSLFPLITRFSLARQNLHRHCFPRPFSSPHLFLEFIYHRPKALLLKKGIKNPPSASSLSQNDGKIRANQAPQARRLHLRNLHRFAKLTPRFRLSSTVIRLPFKKNTRTFGRTYGSEKTLLTVRLSFSFAGR